MHDFEYEYKNTVAFINKPKDFAYIFCCIRGLTKDFPPIKEFLESKGYVEIQHAEAVIAGCSNKVILEYDFHMKKAYADIKDPYFLGSCPTSQNRLRKKGAGLSEEKVRLLRELDDSQKATLVVHE